MKIIKGHLQAFTEIISLLTRHRDLTFEMARRELTDRYVGQVFGLIWAITHPIFMISLYVFIFAFVFKQKTGGTIELPLDYTTYLLSGLVAWMSIQESLSKSCTAITSNTSLVKQVVFPIEILPVKGVIASLFPMIISLALLVGYVLMTYGYLHLTFLLLIPLIIVQIIMMIGLAYIFSSLGAYFRDIKDFMQLFVTAGVFLVPVFYLPNAVPSLFKPILYLNPFSHLVWCYQDVLYFGRIEHPWSWIITLGFGLLVFTLGYRLFRKLKPGLGNVL
jgi:lipopolysaccharide transport system permease protein